VEKMFAHQRSILLTAAACKKPEEKEFADLMKPLYLDLEEINKAKEKYRKERDWQNHFTFVAEGAPVIGWVMIVSVPS
jgi:adenylyl cyclase-associated protein